MFLKNSVNLLHTILLLFFISTPYVSANNALEQINVQLEWKFQFQYAGFIAAKEKGFYKEAGLDVNFIEYTAGKNTIDHVLSRKAHFGIHNSSLVLRNGNIAPVVILSSYLQRSPLVFVTSDTISHPSELKNKRILGTSDEFKYSSLALLLRHFSINQNNSRFVEHTFDISDFAEGKVDAMSAFRSNQLYELDNRGIKYNIIDPVDYGFYMSAVNLYTSRDEALEHPERTQKFIDASNKGWKYALEHTDEIIDVIYQRYSQRKSKQALKFEADATRKLMLLDLYPIGAISEELSQRTFKQLKQTGIINRDESFKQTTLQQLILKAGNSIVLTSHERKFLIDKGKIKLCVDPDWMPFESLHNGKHIGIAADIFKNIGKYLPVPIEVIQTKTWSESIEAAKLRQCDLFSLAASTPERDKYMNFTDSYIDLPIVMATKTDKYFIDNIEQVKDKPIGIVKGYAIAEFLRKEYQDINIIDVKSISEGLEMVERGELFGYIDNLMVIADLIQKKFTGEIKISARLEDNVQLAIGIRNDEATLHQVFQKAVMHVNRKEKQKQKIYNNWVSVKHEMGFDYRLFWQILAAIGLLLIAFLFHYNRLRLYSKQLREMSITDPLTKLFNRIKSDELLHQQYDFFNRHNELCGIILIDIDHFKKINDQYGHQMGDKVLIEFSMILKENIRITDKACRWGGEEFMIICPHCNLNDTETIAIKLLDKIREFQFSHAENLTASMGLSEYMPNIKIDKTIEQADKALYQAKQQGRNQIQKRAP